MVASGRCGNGRRARRLHVPASRVVPGEEHADRTGGQAKVNITVVRPGDLGESERARWRALQKAGPSLDNPFLSVEFALAMHRLRDLVRVAVIQDETGIAGFFPYER